jgi:hypothetical protein
VTAVDLVEFVVDQRAEGEPVRPQVVEGLGDRRGETTTTPGPGVLDSLAEEAKAADGWLESQPLFNPASPAYMLKRERPEHRIIIYLKCQGLTYREIAERIGWSAPGVGNVCKQPWAQRIILAEIGKAGRNAVEVLLNTEDLNSLAKLVQLRDDTEAPKEVQRKCANDILNRKYGMPSQPILHGDVVDPSKLSDAELIAMLPSPPSRLS